MKAEPSLHSEPFCGDYPSKFLDDGRIRLPVEVRRQLRARGVTRLYVTITRSQTALKLWPDTDRKARLRRILRDPTMASAPEAVRALIASSKPIPWDVQGRATISRRLLNHAGFDVNQRVIVLGVNDHFEVWPEGAFSHDPNRR